MKQRLLEAAHGAAVQNTLPPVIHHELRQVHDQDVARRLLATAANVRDHCLHGIAVGRVDDRQRHWDVEGVPAVLHDLKSRAVVVDGERLNRRGTRGARVREGLRTRSTYTMACTREGRAATSATDSAFSGMSMASSTVA